MYTETVSVKRFHEKNGFPVGVGFESVKLDVSDWMRITAANLLSMSERYESIAENTKDPRALRVALLTEELSETIYAMSDCDEVNTLDGLMDLLYVTIGTAVSLWPRSENIVPEAFMRVANSNLTKEKRTEEDMRLRLKGDSYRPPDLKVVLEMFDET